MAGGTEGELLAMLDTLLPDESLRVSAADARGHPDARAASGAATSATPATG
ncbi:hypothetical protein [Nonomuraea sp. NPDC050783]|uniref:hypothetical protein n=1 Tax=Nonomuraea sp. NPDC050783 TaxID=3154634 RepID=UPI003465EA96